MCLLRNGVLHDWDLYDPGVLSFTKVPIKGSVEQFSLSYILQYVYNQVM